jgi:hypothetical protein
MTHYRSLESQLTEVLGLTRRPVAVSSSQQPGIPKFSGSVPAGCSFWHLAAEGRSFYTEACDHYNCAIGCYTHNIPLPPEREAELPATINFMTSIGYIRTEDIPGIARLKNLSGFMSYMPLADVQTQASLLARPTCMAIPAALAGGATASSGCVGNRIYTDLADDQIYMMVPGADLEKIAAELDTILDANAKLTDYHRGRKAELLSVK